MLNIKRSVTNERRKTSLKMKVLNLIILCLSVLVFASCVDTNSYSYWITDEKGNGVYQTMEQKKKITYKYEGFLNDLETLPVSFTYDDNNYRGLKKDFREISRQTVEQGAKVSTEILLKFRDELEVTLQMAIYPDYCAYEWTVYFENKGENNSAVLENLKCADLEFTGASPVLKGIYGDGGTEELGPYAPYTFDMSATGSVSMTPPTGRSTYDYFPYFNVEYGNGGTFVALGWPIMWGASFTYDRQSDDSEAVRFLAGQETFSSYLEPGERIRTPLVAFLEYEGRDEARAMNLWRHWFIDCNMRRIDGDLFPPHLSGGTSWVYNEMKDATDENQIAAIKKYVDHGVPISYWWMDAGWYFRTGQEQLSTWLHTGTWMVDTIRFPSKFKAISDFGAKHGVKTLLWFEPEVVRLDWNDHDDTYGIPREYMLDNNLVNFGNLDFVHWMLERTSGILQDGGISLYRQDYGINPAGNFNAQNREGRMGIAENLYAQGYYLYWDLLIERFPNMMIDSCAAGGGRNDIESMRRSVPLHKTDHDYSNQEDKQAMHQTLFQWLPYFGACVTGPGTCTQADRYTMRSSYAPWVAMTWNVNYSRLAWDEIRESAYEWREINQYYYNDYYPLTEWGRGNDCWRGWEFFDPELNKGFVQLFRPEKAKNPSYSIKLKGLIPDMTYAVRDADTQKTYTETGAALMEKGITVEIPDAKGSALLYITPV